MHVVFSGGSSALPERCVGSVFEYIWNEHKLLLKNFQPLPPDCYSINRLIETAGDIVDEKISVFLNSSGGTWRAHV